ncbi:MAG: YkvA family protein [Anaerolineae bacterium]
MNRDLKDPKGQDDREREAVGWWQEFLAHFELAWKLLWDERVPLVTKLVPLLTLIYILSPWDIIPDYPFLGLGQADDLVIFLVGLRMFISLSPAEVVASYRRLTSEDEEEAWTPPQEVIDLEPKQLSGESDKRSNKDAA